MNEPEKGELSMKKLKDINWNQVYYFYEVARKMSMKEAAEVTGVSIPTVSEQIKRLETLLETQLFHRRPRRIELTTEGETLYRHAKQMFESGLRFLDVVSPTVIGGYPVRIGVQESFASGLVDDFLLRYFDAYLPFGTLHTVRETHPERLLEHIFEGQLDWGLMQTVPLSPRLESGKVGSSEMVFCTSAEVLERFKNRVEIFQNLPLARSRSDEQLNKLISDHLQAADIFIEETIETDHWDLSLRLAEQGKCVTVIPKNLPLHTLGASSLKTFTIGGPIVVSYFAVWRQTSNRMIAIRKLSELLDTDNKGGRVRSNPLLPGLGTGEPAPIELPHRYEAPSLGSAVGEERFPR
jgi:LysR family transcriptional activator of nhaA